MELSAQAQRVRHLIGSAHWLSDGNHKEAILRSFLRRHLPTSLTVATGFAINPEHVDRLTRQQDILVCDLRSLVPFLVEQEFLIVPSASVAASIEVKSTLSSSVLKDALESILFSGAVLSGQEHPPWRGAVFFATETSDHRQFHRWVRTALEGIPAKHLNPSDGPVSFVAVGEFVAFLDLSQGHLKVLSTKDKSLAFGILDLLSSVRPRLGEVSKGQFELLADASFSGDVSILKLED